jgi:predicted O-linked N-acetylglucosamine transferase (SPINDLY family)
MATISEALAIGVRHHQAGRLPAAEQVYRHILAAEPNHVDALHLLGVLASQMGNHAEAVEHIRRAIALAGTEAPFHSNLGNALQALGRLDEAVASYRRALELNPEFADAHGNLGNVLQAQGHLDEAVSCYRRALALLPGHPGAHYNLGTALQALGRLEEAAACFGRAVQLKPDYADAHTNLGNALRAAGKADEAVACYRQALELQPNSAAAHSNLLLALQYRADATLSGLAQAHAEYERRLAAPLQAAWKPHGNPPDPERRLRLGFVSPDLRRHPVGYFLVPFVENLDRDEGEVFCYSNSPEADDLTTRIRAAATTWSDVFGRSDERLAEQIRADRIDILFDLAGHTAGNRLLAFARKPAPIQVSWAGYVGSTGLHAIDYLLADPLQVPPGAEAHYRERVLRLPDGYVCYDPPPYAPPVSPLPALATGQVTFGSFNNPAKLSPQIVAVWARILARRPQARLVLKYKGIDDPAPAGRLAGMFADHGVDPARVSYLGASPHAELLAHYGAIDIGLDPLPYNGGLTTLEALWMGVPVVTCPGETFAGRHSLTHLSNVGLTSMIARDLGEYVELAVSLAGDRPRLAALRAGLRQRVAASPLCDGKRFAGNLMRLVRGVWREWACRGMR